MISIWELDEIEAVLLAARERAGAPRRTNALDHMLHRCGGCGAWLYAARGCGSCAVLGVEAA